MFYPSMQENLPGFDKAMSDVTTKEIGEEATCQHLQRQIAHWGRYAQFSKDPEFRRRAEARQVQLRQMMAKHQKTL